MASADRCSTGSAESVRSKRCSTGSLDSAFTTYTTQSTHTNSIEREISKTELFVRKSKAFLSHTKTSAALWEFSLRQEAKLSHLQAVTASTPTGYTLEGTWFHRFQEENYEASYQMHRREHTQRLVLTACVMTCLLSSLAFVYKLLQMAGLGRPFVLESSADVSVLQTAVVANGVHMAACVAPVILRMLVHPGGPASPTVVELCDCLTCIVLHMSFYLSDLQAAAFEHEGDVQALAQICQSKEAYLLLELVPALMASLIFRLDMRTLCMLYPCQLVLYFAWAFYSLDAANIVVKLIIVVVITSFLIGCRNEAETLERCSWANVHALDMARKNITDIINDDAPDEEKECLHRMESAIMLQDACTLTDSTSSLKGLGWEELKIDRHIKKVRARQSKEKGICATFILSEEFTKTAQRLTKMTNPTFYDMKGPFFEGTDAFGSELLCPRDRKLGCAFVDTLPSDMCGCCTHFLSWTWGYTLFTVQSALRRWLAQSGNDSDRVFLFMCFFCNNQHRILKDGSANGSDDLESVFFSRLKRIGEVIAIVDTWDNPLYLKRIWTVFEQHAAFLVGIAVEIVMPQWAADEMMRLLRTGEQGIMLIKTSLCNVNSEAAEAWSKDDELKVKSMIRDTSSFEGVNEHVRGAMIKWIGREVVEFMQRIVDEGHDVEALRRVVDEAQWGGLYHGVLPTSPVALMPLEASGDVEATHSSSYNFSDSWSHAKKILHDL